MSDRTLIEVILYVSDMQRAVDFYRSKLGLTVRSPICEDYSDHFWVELATGSCSLCLHKGGAAAEQAGRPKIVFGVSDLRAVREELIAQGVMLGETRSPAPCVYVCDGRDPDGNPFSLESHAQG